MHDTSKMTPAEYASFTGAMSHPVGQQKAEAEAAESQARQASDLDYVGRFVRHLEDPDVRLVTEKTPTCHMPMNEWTNWGEKGKAAILAVVRDGLLSIQTRAAVEKLPVSIIDVTPDCLE